MNGFSSNAKSNTVPVADDIADTFPDTKRITNSFSIAEYNGNVNANDIHKNDYDDDENRGGAES